MTHLVNLTNKEMESEYNFEGYEALDGAQNKLGKIESVIADGDSMQPRYLVVNTGGWFSRKQVVVPVGDVSRIDDQQHHVYFNTLTKDALQSGSYPPYDESWWDKNDGAGWSGHERDLATSYQQSGHSHAGTAKMNTGEVDYNSKLYQRPEGAQRLQLMEERLRANKERYEAGSVKIGKRITQHTETINVPVTEERVVIERTAVSGQAATGAAGKIGTEQTIDVPVMKERVNVEKEAVVAEEVNVRKETTQRTERVQETVRKEELDVRDQGGLVTERGKTTGQGYQPDSPRPIDSVERAARENKR